MLNACPKELHRNGAPGDRRAGQDSRNRVRVSQNEW